MWCFSEPNSEHEMTAPSSLLVVQSRGEQTFHWKIWDFVNSRESLPGDCTYVSGIASSPQLHWHWGRRPGCGKLAGERGWPANHRTPGDVQNSAQSPACRTMRVLIFSSYKNSNKFVTGEPTAPPRSRRYKRWLPLSSRRPLSSPPSHRGLLLPSGILLLLLLVGLNLLCIACSFSYFK